MELIEALKELRDRACTGTVPYEYMGICNNIISRLVETDSVDACGGWMDLLIKTWPLNYGDNQYPIGGWQEYRDKGNHWKGDNLARRLSLINHMINQLES